MKMCSFLYIQILLFFLKKKKLKKKATRIIISFCPLVKIEGQLMMNKICRHCHKSAPRLTNIWYFFNCPCVEHGQNPLKYVVQCKEGQSVVQRVWSFLMEGGPWHDWTKKISPFTTTYDPITIDANGNDT
jgi:hypothetical protein